MHQAFTLSKSERLCSTGIINKLFEKGNRGFTRFPFRFLWVEAEFESKQPIQVLFTVSKRNFPSAVKRNRIKRQLRELYRLHKPALYEALEGHPKQYALMIGYSAREALKHETRFPLFTECMNILKNELEKDR